MLDDFFSRCRSWPVVRDVIEFRENLRMEHGQRVPVLAVNQVLFPEGSIWVHIQRDVYGHLLEAIAVDQRPIAVCLDRMLNGVPLQDFEPYGVLATVTEIRGEGDHLAVRLLGGARFRIEERLRSHGILYGRGYRQKEITASCLPELQAVTQVLKIMLAAESDIDPSACAAILEDAAQTSYRLAERLPIAMSIKLKLLELDDPNTRLTIMAQFLKRERLLSEKSTFTV